MKKIILSLLLATSITACSQEVNKPVLCLSTKQMFDSIFEKYQESILMSFDPDTENSKVVLTVNPKTKTWSIIEYNLEIACLLASGSNYRVIGNNRTSNYI